MNGRTEGTRKHLETRDTRALCPRGFLCSTNTSVDSQQLSWESKPRARSETTEQTLTSRSIGFIDIVNIPERSIQETFGVVDTSINLNALKS